MDKSQDMQRCINNAQYRETTDRRMWRWTAEGKFSVKSYYQFLNFGGVYISWEDIWKIYVPLKVKITVWLTLKHRLNSGDLLLRKGIQRSPVCVLCGVQNESVEHISCHVALLDLFGYH